MNHLANKIFTFFVHSSPPTQRGAQAHVLECVDILDKRESGGLIARLARVNGFRGDDPGAPFGPRLRPWKLTDRRGHEVY